jgi:hypothetical protein
VNSKSKKHSSLCETIEIHPTDSQTTLSAAPFERDYLLEYLRLTIHDLRFTIN